jgi:membrane-associated phospholipid phosphatase
MPKLIRSLTAGFFVFDWLMMGYSILIITTLVAFGEPAGMHLNEIAFYSFTAIAPFLVVAFTRHRTERVLSAVRYLYPVLLFTFLYRSTADTMFLLFDHYLDDRIVSFEMSILGIEPTIWTDRFLPQPILTDVLSACYFSYYLMIPVFTLWVFVRKDYRILRRSLSAISLTFFLSYLLFFLFPAEGPRWHQAENYLHPVTGVIFRPMVDLVIANGAVHGGAMPSSHTGVALIILIYCWRHYRRVAIWLTAVVFGLAGGAVWGRFHYVTDIVVGALVAIVALWVTDRWQRKENGSATSNKFDESMNAEYVS